jgi:hypothetical protein
VAVVLICPCAQARSQVVPLLLPCTCPHCNMQVQADDPRISRWTLSTFQFDRQWEFSWMALNMTPLRNQKIHWRSVPGTVGGSLGSGLEVANRWAQEGLDGAHAGHELCCCQHFQRPSFSQLHDQICHCRACTPGAKFASCARDRSDAP